MKKPVFIEHMYRFPDSLTTWEYRRCFYLFGEYAEQYHEVERGVMDDGEGCTVVSAITRFDETELFVPLIRRCCPKINYWFGSAPAKLSKHEPQG